MQKNVASQKKIFFAFDATTSLPKTGDAANITPYEQIDYGSVTAITDTSMSEIDATNAKGYYVCDLTQAETNGNEILFSAKSATANIVVVGVPALVVTTSAGSSGSVAQSGDAYAVVNSGTFGNSALKTLIDTLDDFVDTEVAAIKAKTDNLPTDPADASDIAASFATVNTKLDTIDDFLDTEVAAIKAKTDNLPVDPADASDIAASFATVNTKLDTIDDFLDTEVAAIKAKTDNLPADPADASDIAGAFATLSAHGDATWATATGFAIAGDAMTLTAAYNFAKGTVAMTEAYRANGATATPAQALYELLGHLGEKSIAGTAYTMKKLDHSTTAMTFALDDATTPTSITRDS